MLHTFASLYSQFESRCQRNALTASIRYNLAAQMRASHVTIRQLAIAMNISQTRVRVTRSMDRVDYGRALDYQEAIEKIANTRALEAAKDALPKSWQKHVWATRENFTEAHRLVRGMRRAS